MSQYDRIGTTYSHTRQSDPRIAQQILRFLQDADTILNVGAGTGAYEPADRQIIAVEPSRTMIDQRSNRQFTIQGGAEHLPLADKSTDAALAILTIHHWHDVTAGLREMQRVSRGPIVILTWDQSAWEDFWLIRDYHTDPSALASDRRVAVPVDLINEALGDVKDYPVMIPHDCLDGFHGAFWRRPEAYLDPVVRAGISTYARMEDDLENRIVERLRQDLESGAWNDRYSDLLKLDEIDLGYRLIVASPAF